MTPLLFARTANRTQENTYICQVVNVEKDMIEVTDDKSDEEAT